MNIDETTLIEIQDYINALDEKVGLKPETMADVRNALSKHKTKLKNLRLGFVVGQSEQLPCEHNYEPDTTCGVDITCCTKCGDIIQQGYCLQRRWYMNSKITTYEM